MLKRVFVVKIELFANRYCSKHLLVDVYFESKSSRKQILIEWNDKKSLYKGIVYSTWSRDLKEKSS